MGLIIACQPLSLYRQILHTSFEKLMRLIAVTRQLPSTQALLCFEAVARTGSVTRASESLHMTQSAVSRQVQTLENLLGTALFERSRQRLRLNELGAAYFEQVSGVLNELRGATQRTRRAASGHLCVGIEPALASSWLIPRLKDFNRDHPQISVELITDMERLHAGSAPWDIAIVYGEPVWTDKACIPLMQEMLLAVAAPELLDNGPTLASYANVLDYPIVQHTGPFSTSGSWLGAAGLSEAEIQRLPGPRMETFSLVMQCATQGLGIAFLPTYFVAEALDRGSLVRASELQLACEQFYYLVLPKQGATPAVAMFSNWLQSLATPGMG